MRARTAYAKISRTLSPSRDIFSSHNVSIIMTVSNYKLEVHIGARHFQVVRYIKILDHYAHRMGCLVSCSRYARIAAHAFRNAVAIWSWLSSCK